MSYSSSNTQNTSQQRDDYDSNYIPGPHEIEKWNITDKNWSLT